MRTMTVLTTLIIFLAATQTVLAADPTAEEIMEKAVKAIKLDGAESIATLIIFDAKGNKRVRKTASVSKLYDKGLTEKRIIRFLTPADVKGTSLLTFDYENKTDDMWLYLPALRKTRRIVASEKAKSFMGSEFTYADIAVHFSSLQEGLAAVPRKSNDQRTPAQTELVKLSRNFVRWKQHYEGKAQDQSHKQTQYNRQADPDRTRPPRSPSPAVRGRECRR